MFLEFLRIQNGLQFYVGAKYPSQIRSLIIYAVSHKRMPTFVSARRAASCASCYTLDARCDKAVTVVGGAKLITFDGQSTYRGKIWKENLEVNYPYIGDARRKLLTSSIRQSVSTQ